MTVRKVNLYSLCVLALLPAIVLWKFMVRHVPDWTFLLLTLFFVIVAWGIGILLGIGLAAIVKRPSIEPYLYLTSQLSVIVTIVVFVFNALSAKSAPHPDLANVTDNRSFVNLEKSSYEGYSLDYVRTAFLKLESSFDDPNSFHLEKYSCRWKDTVINAAADTIYAVSFTYLKHDKVFFAKVTVLGDNAVIDSKDSERKPDQDPLMKAGAWARRGDLEDVRRSLRDLPDSTRNKVLDILSQ